MLAIFGQLTLEFATKEAHTTHAGPVQPERT